MRGKEEAHDYRYFPEPDLAPLELDEAMIEARRRALPELPLARQERFVKSLGLSAYHADVIVRDPGMARYFEACLELYAKGAQEIANWVVNNVREEMNTRGVDADDLGLSPARLVDLIRATDDGKVSKQKARDVFKAMLGNEKSADDAIEELGLGQISDDSQLRRVVEEVVAEQPKAFDDAKEGKKQSVNFLVGQVMRKTKGKANPGMVAKMIQELAGE